MSASDLYYTVPLSILRSGDSALAVLEACVAVGIVNAGIGYRETYDEEKFLTLLEEADEKAEKQGLPTLPTNFSLKDNLGRPIDNKDSLQVWLAAHAGAQLLKIKGGNRANDAQTWASHNHEGEVFFRIKSDWLWGAVCSARRDAGQIIESDLKPISWREFRILAAILSAPVKKFQGFVFLGWESIQARACGFHRKALLAENKNSLPAHCQHLSRSQIDLTTSRLEVLRFYLRFRYSKGDRGGKTAYSFRHETSEKLAEAIGNFQAEYCFKSTLQNNRAKDRTLSLRIEESRK
jgi:hypothetical protein